MSTVLRSGPKRIEVLIVLGGGAFGGLLSWLYTVTVGNPPVVEKPWALPASILLGVGASLIGVYLIAGTDTTRVMRCAAFAVLCGFCWKPVYDAGHALIDQAAERRTEQEVAGLAEEAQKVAIQLRNAPDTLLATRTDEAAMLVKELLGRSVMVSEPAIKSKAVAGAGQVVGALKSVILRKPEEGAAAATDIGKAAIRYGESGLVDSVVLSLSAVGKEPNQLSLVPVAYRSISEIAQNAESEGELKLAIETRLAGAQVVLDAVRTTYETQDTAGLQMIPVHNAKADLEQATRFYDSVNKSDKVQSIRGKQSELIELAPRLRIGGGWRP